MGVYGLSHLVDVCDVRGAVFSSLLGVWQGIPYLFADFLSIRKQTRREAEPRSELTHTKSYVAYLIAMAIVPLPLLSVSVKEVQLAYTVLGSLFMPLLAMTLLMMNNRIEWVGRDFRNGLLTNTVLVATLVFFGYVGYIKIAEQFVSAS